MTFSKKAQRIMFALWLLFVPLGTLLVYLYSPTGPSDWKGFGGFLVLALLSSMFPFFFSWNDICFGHLGSNCHLFKVWNFSRNYINANMMIPLMYHLKISRDSLFKYFFNSFMFFSVSVICGTFVVSLGYEIGNVNIRDAIVYGSIFAISYLSVNHLFLYMREYLCKWETQFFTKDLYWEFACLFITLPFGLSLYLFEDKNRTDCSLVTSSPSNIYFIVITHV